MEADFGREEVIVGFGSVVDDAPLPSGRFDAAYAAAAGAGAAQDLPAWPCFVNEVRGWRPRSLHEAEPSDDDEDDAYPECAHEDPDACGERPQEPQRRDAAGHRSKRKKRRGGERRGQFWRTVLAWDIDAVGSRRALGLAPLAEAPATYTSSTAFYDACFELAVEEARAGLAAAVDVALRRPPILVKYASSSAENDDPGCHRLVFVNAVSNAPLDKQPAMQQARARDFSSGSVVVLEREGRSDLRTLAAVAVLSADKKSVVLVVCEDASRAIQESEAEAAFTLRPVASVLPQSRMANATTRRRLSVHHLATLRGEPPAKHTKFEDSDDEHPEISRFPPPSPGAMASLNESQRHALVGFLESATIGTGTTSLVQGPPGCGKTQFVSSAIASLHAAGDRLAVCAPSNKGVTNALERFFRDNADFPRCKVKVIGDAEALGVEDGGIVAELYAPGIAHRLAAMDACVDMLVGIQRLVPTFCAEFEELLLRFCALPGDQKLKSIRKELITRKARIEELALKEARIIFCTLIAAGQSALRRHSFDSIIIDEAGQALDPEILLALDSTRAWNCLLVGDPQQLPATLLSDEARRARRGESLMQRLMHRCNHPFTRLDVQYRMHPAISRLPSRLYYESTLQDAPEVKSRATPFASALEPYSFVDVDGVETGGRASSKSNSVEVEVIVSLLKHLHKKLRLPLERISVIALYAAQVRSLQAALHRAGLSATSVRSVDGYQGAENDVVIVSFVRANAGGVVGFVGNSQRLNVALTRARHMLVLVGSAKTLGSERASADLRALVQDARERAVLHRASSVMRRVDTRRRREESAPKQAQSQSFDQALAAAERAIAEAKQGQGQSQSFDQALAAAEQVIAEMSRAQDARVTGPRRKRRRSS